MAIKISVQMCTYNRKSLLERALAALFEQDLPHDQYEIVLVDDGSTDGTGDYVRTLQPPCHFTYVHQENSGLAHGRNQGIRRARGEIVLFIDDDIVASPQLLSEHVKTHEQHPDQVVRGWVNHIDDLENITGPRFNLQDISTAFFWTSNVSARRKHLVQAGMFDEDFTEYGWEDLELGMRLKALGLGMKYNKDAIVYHYKSRWNIDDVTKMCRQAQAQGRMAVRFVEKCPTLRVRLATGLHAPRLLAHRILSLGGILMRFFDRVLSQRGKEKLSGLALFCGRQKVMFIYYQTIIETLRERNQHGAPPVARGEERRRLPLLPNYPDGRRERKPASAP